MGTLHSQRDERSYLRDELLILWRLVNKVNWLSVASFLSMSALLQESAPASLPSSPMRSQEPSL